MIVLIGVCVLIVCLLLLFHMVRKAFTDHAETVIIKQGDLPEALSGFRLFFISDVHKRGIRSKTLAALGEKPDIVCIGGDFIERGVPENRMRNNIRLLKQWQVPIYFVWGNNDKEVDVATYKRILKEEDVILLEDEAVLIEKAEEKFYLVGFDYHEDPLQNRAFYGWETLQDTFTILLTHKPSDYNVLPAIQKAYFDIVLAGHTHGGQIRIFGLGPYTNGGLFQTKYAKLFISEGYGFSLLPFRLGTRAECHLICLE